jgi:hypothetical protein
MDKLADFCELLACLFLGFLALILLLKIATDKIDLEWLISEDNGHASMSRFQLLIFTFVIAISLVKLTEKLDKFPIIDSGVLTLLGISASTYAVGKGIQKAGGESETPSPNSPKPNNPANPVVPGPSSFAEVAQQAAADAARHSEAAGKAAQQADASANRAQSAGGGQGPERAI